MAVVFISPRQRQKMFLRGIILIFALFIVLISFLVFLSKPKPVSPTLVFNKPKVNIDMKVFDTDEFKDLQAFSQMQIQFTYTGFNKLNKSVKGFISAISEEDARSILEASGIITISTIKEAEVGRDDPFKPYYQVSNSVSTQNTVKTTTTKKTTTK